MESLTPASLEELKPGNAKLTSLTNEKGGIRDDTIITRRANEDKYYMVINAGCTESDLKYLHEQLQKWDNVNLDIIHGRSLLALQGPKAADILQQLVNIDVSDIGFMTQIDGTVNGVKDCFISRSGYTGEDGFELSVPDLYAEDLARKFLELKTEIVGLGARDTLRLEAGLCLMGQEMNEDITPIEAGLKFTIGKRRREQGGFPGAEKIIKQFNEGTDRVRVGFIVDGKRAPRTHYLIKNDNGEVLGEVTSGTVSPSLKEQIGMGYVPTAYSKPGTIVNIEIRDTLFPARITPLPFVKTTFYRKPKV